MKPDVKLTIAAWGGDSSKGYQSGVRKELSEQTSIWISKILEYAPDKKKLDVLDVGTGPGFFAISLARLGHNVSAIDVTPDMIERARENASEFKADVRFEVMNADSLQFPDDSFDLVVSRVVTWTIPDMYECYKEWRRVLRPGGKVIVFDSNFRVRFFDDTEERRIREIVREQAMKEGPLYSGFAGYNYREEYADSRPMIGTVRPQWDRNMLVKLCYQDIITVDDVFKEEPPSFHYLISPKFLIVATKPGPDEDRFNRITEHWGGNPACMSARTSVLLTAGKGNAYANFVSERIPKGCKVLDLCCGCGMVSIPLSKMGFEVCGVDNASRILEEAERCSSEHDGSCDFILAPSHRLPFGDGTMDAVICRNSVWTIYYLRETLAEVRRVLKKNGKFIVTDGDWFYDFSKLDAYYRKSELGNLRANLGLGGYAFIDEVFGQMPQNKGNGHDCLASMAADSGFRIEEDERMFTDPSIPDGLWDHLNKGYYIMFRAD